MHELCLNQGLNKKAGKWQFVALGQTNYRTVTLKAFSAERHHSTTKTT